VLREGVLDVCVGEGEEYNGEAAFGGQERCIYAAVALALDQAATTRPRQGTVQGRGA